MSGWLPPAAPLTGVGHDLRTPLAAMRSAVESLQGRCRPGPGALPRRCRQPDRHQCRAWWSNCSSTPGSKQEQQPTDLTQVSVAELADEAAPRPSAQVADRHHVKIDLHADSAGVRPRLTERACRGCCATCSTTPCATHPPTRSWPGHNTPGHHVEVRRDDHGARLRGRFQARASSRSPAPTRRPRRRVRPGSAWRSQDHHDRPRRRHHHASATVPAATSSVRLPVSTSEHHMTTTHEIDLDALSRRRSPHPAAPAWMGVLAELIGQSGRRHRWACRSLFMDVASPLDDVGSSFIDRTPNVAEGPSGRLVRHQRQQDAPSASAW